MGGVDLLDPFHLSERSSSSVDESGIDMVPCSRLREHGIFCGPTRLKRWSALCSPGIIG